MTELNPIEIASIGGGAPVSKIICRYPVLSTPIAKNLPEPVVSRAPAPVMPDMSDY